MILRERLKLKNNPTKGLQCYGCEGFGHLRLDCPTHLKKQQKDYYVSLSDESVNHDTALTGRCDSDDESYGEDVTYDEFFYSYEEVCLEREKQKKLIIKLELEKGKIISTVAELQNELMFLTHELESMTKSIRMFHNGSDMLDEILLVGKRFKNFTRVGFNSQSLNKQGETS